MSDSYKDHSRDRYPYSKSQRYKHRDKHHVSHGQKKHIRFNTKDLLKDRKNPRFFYNLKVHGEAKTLREVMEERSAADKYFELSAIKRLIKFILATCSFFQKHNTKYGPIDPRFIH